MHKGLTRAEGIVLAALGMLFLAFIPTVFAQTDARAREMSNRAICSANLRGIGQSMAVYGASEDDMYPCLPPTSATTYDASFKADVIEAASPDAATETLFLDKKYGNQPDAALWMLVENGSVAPKQFMCRSDAFAGQPSKSTATLAVDGKDGYFGNFQSGKSISYSVAFYWTENEQGKPAIARFWHNDADASLPIMSDAAPYMVPKAAAPSTQPMGSHPQKAEETHLSVNATNSPNHDRDGQNVVYDDNHVDFARSPLAGQNKDSIWGIRKDAKAGQGGEEVPIEAGKLPHPPRDEPGVTDTVMVPARDENGDWR